MSSTDEKVAFVNRHQPVLTDGEYTIAVTQNVSLLGDAVNGVPGDLNEEICKTIYVAGERYSIESKNIFRQYPPPNKTGDYSNVLPHIELTRSTLPWERVSGGDEYTPWMFLFVYDDDDIAQGNVLKPQSVSLDKVFQITPANGSNEVAPGKIPLVVEPGDESAPGTLSTKGVDCIRVNLEWFNEEIFPTQDVLQLMTSVRKNYADSSTQTSEHAICMANRLPKQGVRSYACLLSLELRLTKIGSDLAYQQQGVVVVGQSAMTTFVCLAEWSFACVESQSYQVNQTTIANFKKLGSSNPGFSALSSEVDAIPDKLYTTASAFQSKLRTALKSSFPGKSEALEELMACFKVPDHTFEWYLQNLSSASFHSKTMPPPTGMTEDEVATQNEYLSEGAIPFLHHLDDGAKTISWFRGPLRPNNANNSETVELPVLASDELLRFDTTLNMLDVTYAAAWELGRMMTLKNKSVAMDLYSLKRQVAMQAHRNTSKAAAILGRTETEEVVQKEVIMVTEWLEQLSQLKSVPFNYLVPDERMLPEESIRFFSLDHTWLNCLLDGAMSIGRISSNATDSESIYKYLGISQPSDKYCGFILRSEVVSGWPNFEVSAAGEENQDLTELTKTKLGPNIIVYLFKGGTQLSQVDIHLKPEALHFGFDVSYHGDSPAYSKEARFQFPAPSSSSEGPNPLIRIGMTWKSPLFRVVNMEQLNVDLHDKSGSTEIFTSAQFAMNMIEGVPNVIFANTAVSGSTSDDVLGSTEGEAADVLTKFEDGVKNVADKVEDDVKAIVEKVEDAVKAKAERVETAAKDVLAKVEDLGHEEQDEKPEKRQIPAAEPSENREEVPTGKSSKTLKKLIIGAIVLAAAAITCWLLVKYVL